MTGLRAFWPAAIGLVVLAAGSPLEAQGPADAQVRLVAGEPTVLVHPPINKSIGNAVHCLTFLDGGARLATGAASGVLVWDVPSGKLLQTLEVDERGVDALALDPSGTLLVAGGASGVIQVWDARTLKPVRTLGPAPGAVRGLSISSDGKLLAAAGPNGQLGAADKEFGVLLWDLPTGRALPTIPHPPSLYGTTVLAFLPDGKRLVSAQDRTLRVVDVHKGEIVQTVEVPHLPRTLGSIAVGGNRLITGAHEHKLRLWDTDHWREVDTWYAHASLPPPRCGVSLVNFSPDGRYVLSGGMDGMVGVWEAASGRKLLELDARGEVSGRWITGVVMTPDGRMLAASHYGSTATIWRISREE
jgi:WD40 repeat protein